MRFMVAVLLACCLLAGCRKAACPQAAELDAFVAGGFDDVTVYAIAPVSPATPQGQDNDTAHFHGFPIRNQVLIADHDEGRKLAAETSAAMREGAEPSKCFDPHHGLRVRKGNSYFDFVICYDCNQVQVWGGAHRGAFVSSSERSQSALDAVLKRGKP